MQSRSISTCPAPKFLLSHCSIQDSLVNTCNQQHWASKAADALAAPGPAILAEGWEVDVLHARRLVPVLLPGSALALFRAVVRSAAPLAYQQLPGALRLVFCQMFGTGHAF